MNQEAENVEPKFRFDFRQGEIPDGLNGRHFGAVGSDDFVEIPVR